MSPIRGTKERLKRDVKKLSKDDIKPHYLEHGSGFAGGVMSCQVTHFKQVLFMPPQSCHGREILGGKHTELAWSVC